MTKQFTIVDYLSNNFLSCVKNKKVRVQPFNEGEFIRMEVTAQDNHMKYFENNWNAEKVRIEPMYYRGTKLHANAFDKRTKPMQHELRINISAHRKVTTCY